MKLHRQSVLVPLLLLLPILCAASDLGKLTAKGPVDITAETVQYDRENNVYTARGDVEMREGSKSLKADFVTYDEITEEVVAEGKVVFRDEGDQVDAERLTLNLGTKLGTIEKGNIFLTKGNFYISGQEITKTGEATYIVRQGRFTTCGWDKPAWTFSAKDVQIKVQGFATVKSAAFRILDAPILYLPWAMFPVVTERQSGLLLPELTLSSRDGAIFSQAFFWAIDKDKDATFFLDVIQKRGIKPGAEYRYALSDTLKGQWYGSIIDDKDYKHGRYRIKGEHEQLIGDLSLKSQVDHSWDIDYLKDFGENPGERNENRLKSTVFAEKPFGQSLLTVETSYNKTLLQKDNDTTFKYLPFMSYFMQYLPVIKDAFYVNLSSDLLNLYREEGDKFSRLTVAPAVHIPYSWKGLNFLVGVTGYEKIYAINRDQESDSRDTKKVGSVKVETDVTAQFIKHSTTDVFNIGRYQSLFKPRVRYTYVPNSSVHDIPIIDPSDQVSQVNAVTYSLGHYLTALSKDGAREISVFEVEQTYGLSDDLTPSDIYDGSGHRFSDIRAKLTLTPGAGLSTTHETVFNTYGDGFRILRNSLHYANPPHFKFHISRNYTKDLVNELDTGFIGTYGSFDGLYRIRYSLKDSAWIDTVYAITYHPKCWSITLSLARERRPRDTSIRISFDLAGITQRGKDSKKIGGF